MIYIGNVVVWIIVFNCYVCIVFGGCVDDVVYVLLLFVGDEVFVMILFKVYMFIDEDKIKDVGIVW